jgi:hypothetical protein
MKILIISLILLNSAYSKEIHCKVKDYNFEFVTKLKKIDIEGYAHNNKIKLHIENTDNFNINDDYLIVYNKNHGITYPIKCNIKL